MSDVDHGSPDTSVHGDTKLKEVKGKLHRYLQRHTEAFQAEPTATVKAHGKNISGAV